jgi:hypothetical protein
LRAFLSIFGANGGHCSRWQTPLQTVRVRPTVNTERATLFAEEVTNRKDNDLVIHLYIRNILRTYVVNEL